MKTPFQLIGAAFFGATVLALAACTTQSGPTYDIRAVAVTGQPDRVFRVSCDGLFGGAGSCARAAEQFCKDKGFTPLEMIDRVSGGQPRKDPREITFVCGKPQPPRAAQPQPQAQPQPPQAAAQPAARQQVLLQGNANFATGSATLTPDARRSLDRFLQINRGVEFRRVAILGYTDSTGSEEANLRLSDARAHSVATYLLTGGLRAQQFDAQGMGVADPITSNTPEDGRAQNRRVEVRIEMR